MDAETKSKIYFNIGLSLTIVVFIGALVFLVLTINSMTKEQTLCEKLGYDTYHSGFTKSGAYCYNILPGMVEHRYYLYSNKTVMVNP
jgi:hypothetical protein